MSNAVLAASRAFATTDSTDKFIKLVIGFLTGVSTTDVARKAECAKAARNLTDMRSLLRVGRVFVLTLKINSLRELFAAQGLASTERKKFVEFFKVIFDLLYAVADHALLLMRAGLVDSYVDVARLTLVTKVTQLIGHVLGVVLNLLDLLDAARKLVYDPPAAQRACKVAAISALRDAADAALALSLLGRVRSGWVLSTRSESALMCLSGVLSTRLAWKYS